MDDGLVVALAAVGIAVGLLGTVLPLLPGLALVWASTLVYGLVAGFGATGVVAFSLITVLGAVGIAGGLVLPHRAAGVVGAARSSVLLGIGLGVVGFFAIPIVGLPIGALAGVFLGELLRTHRTAPAWRATWATAKGFGVASLVQLLAGLAMAAVWLVWVLA